MQLNTILAFVGLLNGALAADEIVTVYLPELSEQQDFVGIRSGDGADPEKTTYSITCADTVTSCALPSPGIAVVYGPETFSKVDQENGKQTGTVCDLHNPPIATCSVLTDNNGPWLFTATESMTSYEVTITATELDTPTSMQTSASPTSTSQSELSGWPESESSAPQSSGGWPASSVGPPLSSRPSRTPSLPAATAPTTYIPTATVTVTPIEEHNVRRAVVAAAGTIYV